MSWYKLHSSNSSTPHDDPVAACDDSGSPSPLAKGQKVLVATRTELFNGILTKKNGELMVIYPTKWRLNVTLANQSGNFNADLMETHEIKWEYLPVSSNMASWKIPELTTGL